jgi:hypothetical protein
MSMHINEDRESTSWPKEYVFLLVSTRPSHRFPLISARELQSLLFFPAVIHSFCIYYGIVKDEQWNYHLGKMYGCVCVCVCVCDK